MFSKTIFVLAFAAVAQLAVAQPPACMLGAINGYKTPSDISSVCKDKDITQQIAKTCGDVTADALSAFADVCNKAGVKVATDIPTGTASGSPKTTGNVSAYKTSYVVYTTATFDSSCSCTKTAAVTSATVVGPTAFATGTGATATGTGGAAKASGAAGRLDTAGAALLAGLGVFAAVL